MRFFTVSFCSARISMARGWAQARCHCALRSSSSCRRVSVPKASISRSIWSSCSFAGAYPGCASRLGEPLRASSHSVSACFTFPAISLISPVNTSVWFTSSSASFVRFSSSLLQARPFSRMTRSSSSRCCSQQACIFSSAASTRSGGNACPQASQTPLASKEGTERSSISW